MLDGHCGVEQNDIQKQLHIDTELMYDVVFKLVTLRIVQISKGMKHKEPRAESQTYGHVTHS